MTKEEDRKRRLVIYRKEYKRNRRLWLDEYKATLSCKCGESHPACLEFHHRDPSTKLFRISQAKHESRERILIEMAKCDVICSNCHRKLHSLFEDSSSPKDESSPTTALKAIA